MDLEYDFYTGSMNNVAKSVTRSIGQYSRNYKNIKIGITCSPERRLREHEKSGTKWDKMIVKYRTTSSNFVKQLERSQVDYHWDKVKNKIAGGGGPDGDGPYFLYVLLKAKK